MRHKTVYLIYLALIRRTKMTSTTHFPRTAFIGFDHIFNELERISSHAKDSYPPHNVVKYDTKKWAVELAVAGFSLQDLSIEVKDHVLTVVGDRQKRRASDQYVHRGISTRKFKKGFRLSEYTEVAGADLRDGILTIELEVRLPEDKLPRLIQINTDEKQLA
jgi:molecular chaperone IbpA